MYSAVLFLIIHVSLGAREVLIAILPTTDRHGNILPGEDYAGHTHLGGFARCATAIREVR